MNVSADTPTLESIHALLTDGSIEYIQAYLDPDKHSFGFLRDYVLELVTKKRGSVQPGVRVAALNFTPAY